MRTASTPSRTGARRARLALVTGALLAALVSAPAFAQGNMGFLRDTPFAHFRGNDSKLLREAALAVLKDAKAGNSQSWQNPDTGHSGTVTLDRMFTNSHGQPCGMLRVDSRTRQVSGTSIMALCQRADGQWALDTEPIPN